ncbi:hypothetical protein Btru_040258 [Bulinus truncatus]|nr:hypothetical protein Btru_040258 [Bulinus truncatus]
MVHPPSLQAGLCILLSLVALALGSDEPVNHLILFDSLPPGSESIIDLDIRTNYSGHVSFVEAKDFRVIINITAPSLQQTYDVDARLFMHNKRVVLEVKEFREQPEPISLMWLLIGIACTSLLVLFCTLGYAVEWYKQEHQTCDRSDRKSLSSSGQRTNIYKTSSNMIPLEHLMSHVSAEDFDNAKNLRSNEGLKQVREEPEEEDEAETLDKEQLTKLKMNDVESSVDTEDSDPQERNLIKSRYHSHSKMIHKELIKKGNAGKKTVSYKRTYNGIYRGLPTDQEETSNDEADLRELKSTDTDTDDTHLESLQVSLISKGEPTYANGDKETNVEKSGEPAYANDPMRLVSADIHKAIAPNPQYKHISIEKSLRAGNLYVTPLELKPVLSTFTPGLVSTPKSAAAVVKSPQGVDGKDANNDFDKISDRGTIYPPWSAQNLPVMADIMEDPREDQTSVMSDSANSASIYGSSEIFNAADAENTYYNLDSDSDHPCDVDDIFSDGELPSPFLLHKLGSSVQTNDDIKLIPGALKSPGPNYNRIIHKVRPNSSILFTSTDAQDSLNAKKTNKAEENVFEFPPPPQSLLVNEEDKTTEENPSGEYIQIQQTGRVNPQQTKTGKGKMSLNQTYMNITILTTLCILALSSGVYCSMAKHETKIEITVLSPKYLVQNFTRIFFNLERDTEVLNHDNFHLYIYDVSQPLLENKNSTINRCLSSSCDQGCDEATGQCICYKGYKLVTSGECIDINECMEGKAKCDKAAGCYNRKGSYDCICGEDFYGSGKKCRVCKPPCSPGEFESRQCTNDHDRECKNSSLLEAPIASENVIFEEKHQIKDDETNLEKLAPHYVGFSRYTLHRGTGIVIELTVRFIDAAQRFLAKNSSNFPNTEKLSPAILKSSFVRHQCPSPIPDYYILRYKKNENQNYKLIENGSIEECDTPKFGENILRLTGDNGSFVCSQPGSLTNIFRIDESFFLARTKWVDKNKRCQRYSQACESCTRNCGTSMLSGDESCQVRGDENDNGLSPRLMMCYNCCVKKNCSSDCKEYHKRRCQPEQCLRGNLLQFTLEPSWESSRDGHFYCHIAPVSQQSILEMDYKVKSATHDKELYMSTISIFGDKEWEKSGAMKYRQDVSLIDEILDISIDSGVDLVPDILEEEVNLDRRIFKVGNYKSNGAKMGASVINQQYVFLRPTTPHGMPALLPAHQECTHTGLNDMLLASNMENLYLLNSKLEAVINFSPEPFVVTNSDSQPTVTARLSRDRPILSKLFPLSVLNVSSFTGNLVHNGSHWITSLSGNVFRCFLSIKIHGPNYENEIDFNCDAIILCPRNFTFQFSWPTSDRKGMSKDVIIVIKDEKSVHHFRVFKTSETPSKTVENFNPMQHAKGKNFSQRQKNSNLPLSLPYLLAIAGIIILLTVLAIIGLVFQPGLPETPNVQWFHPFMATFYMTFQFLYSIVVSGTAFFIILTIMTHPNVTFLQQYVHSGAVNMASVHVELLHLQNHLETEIKRLDEQADDLRNGCLEDVKKIVMDLKKLHQSILEATHDDFERHHLNLLLSRQKLHVRDKLIKDLNQFRSQFTSAARSVLRQVNQNALASYQNILNNNSWLVGTRFLYGAVSLLRKTHNQEIKSFMEWTGIKSELSHLEIDLSFSLPALPRLDDMIDLSVDPLPITREAQENRSSNEPIRSIEMHNNWFFPLDDLKVKQAAEMQLSKQDRQDSSHRKTSLSFYIFLGLLCFCDLILLGHRMCKSWTSTKLFVFGFPEYVRKKKDEEEDPFDVPNDSSNNQTSESNCKKFCNFQFIKMFLTQDHYIDLHTAMTNARLKTHSDYINTVDLPIFQTTVNGYVIRHQTVVEIYKKYLYGIQSLNAALYCEHLKAIGVSTNCSESMNTNSKSDTIAVPLATCKFHPVAPKLYNGEVLERSFQSDQQMEATLNYLQNIILQTSQLIVIYLSIIILKELACAVLWIMIQR